MVIPIKFDLLNVAASGGDVKIILGKQESLKLLYVLISYIKFYGNIPQVNLLSINTILNAVASPVAAQLPQKEFPLRAYGQYIY